MIICDKCGSSHISVVYNTYAQSKSRSFIWNTLMICCTCGLWLIWALVRKKKEKIIHEKICVCQNCGNSWKIC